MDPWICEPHHSPSPDDGGADALLPNEADGEHAHLGGPADLVEESGMKNEVFYFKIAENRKQRKYKIQNASKKFKRKRNVGNIRFFCSFLEIYLYSRKVLKNTKIYNNTYNICFLL